MQPAVVTGPDGGVVAVPLRDAACPLTAAPMTPALPVRSASGGEPDKQQLLDDSTLAFLHSIGLHVTGVLVSYPAVRVEAADTGLVLLPSPASRRCQATTGVGLP